MPEPEHFALTGQECAELRAVYEVFRQAAGLPADADNFTYADVMKFIKARHGFTDQKLAGLTFQQISSLLKEQTLSSLAQAIVDVLRKHGPLRGRDIAPKAGYHYDYVRRELANLKRQGVIRKSGDGYSLYPLCP